MDNMMEWMSPLLKRTSEVPIGWYVRQMQRERRQRIDNRLGRDGLPLVNMSYFEHN